MAYFSVKIRSIIEIKLQEQRVKVFSVILSHPQMGENIGAAARAMLNFGLTDLRLIAPRDGWPNEKATANAAGALDIMPPVKVYDSTAESIADLHYVLATTSRDRNMIKSVFSPESAVEELCQRLAQNQKTGILFGGERSGLLNDEIALCHGIISIPTRADFSSLNLAQSVLLLGYEWIKTQETMTAYDDNNPPPAPLKEKEAFFKRLETELEAAHFFRSEGSEAIMRRNVRNIFSRADITQGELNILHGILSALRGNKKKRGEK